ncbi:hypothetical protein A2348_00530 [Candidatus Uhrbacteria bacterium RIFOXYB12_FULL_58_10]|uniref:PEGA domain-containing protein n=1 Tax=Candidatus Uhrbacteria bacterium RIFOXYB2_FULL_57_15 TaxID=1802422 RepID=A0A1F7W8H6_9BACT|nr:MAG: hypothetical protein A2348_00530 [Candidatus Uhrbacteria bacterium RIFOXYB12_FULL_58_10]OGL98394.1 MAG: hypothetical protein A2304_01715 [Candidatus Uhrbacteria bacterium RIFOXYB2_FULL_57_15]OGL99428.1 MAG: hypothetical protein A2501_02770 [Candidatus Uhrbacteria bacterium RIFOXYC12_FULL_57_11]
MTKRARKVIFILFFIGFFVTAPAIVLYTAGYRYNFGTGHIVQTGVLSIISTPKGGSISLDGERVRSSTPALLKNILPGDHHVLVEKSGYISWEKTLTVESRSTTFADDLVLFLKTEPVLIREMSPAATSINPTSGRIAYAQTEGQWTEIWIHDPVTKEETLVSRLPIGSGTHVALEWPYASSILSIRTTIGAKTTIRYVDADSGETVDALSNEKFDLSVLADRVAVSRRTGDTNVVLAYVALGSYEFCASPDDIVMLEDSERKRVVLIRAEGGDQPILLNANASFWEWEPNGKRLLYSDGYDLHVYDAASHTDSTITRLSAAVTDVAWYPEHAIVLYAQDDAVYATELDHRGGRNTIRLVTGSGMNTLHVLQDTLYFFGRINETNGVYARLLTQ